MSRIRTFVGIEATDEIRTGAQRLMKKLAATDEDIRWVRPENVHLTVKFLGDVDDREIYSVCSMVKQAAKRHSEFHVECGSVGAFPSLDRPRTIWIGVDDAASRLAALQGDVDRGLSELRFPVEPRQYHGHLTLGRIRQHRTEATRLRELLESESDSSFGSLPIRELVVFASELNREGPNYTVLGRCPLS